MALLESCVGGGGGDCSSAATAGVGGGGSGGSGSVLLSLEPHKAVPAPFLTKTYQLVDDPSTDHIVSWGDDQSTFVVWRPPEFARDLLPNYFKHNNFSSFVRQLNTYGFRKIVPERWEFANEFFRKGEKHLLCEIHRRKTSTASSPPSHPLHHLPFQNYHHPSSAYFTSFPGSDVELLPTWCDSSPASSSSPRFVTSSIGNGYVAAAGGGVASGSSSASASALLEDNERLRRSNAMLLSELAHMRKLYNDIIYFVQNHVRPVAPSSSYPSSLLLTTGGAATNQYPSSSIAGNAVQRLPPGIYPNNNNNKQYNSGSTTSSSSLTIVEEPPVPNTNTRNNSNNNKYNSDHSNNNSSSGGGGEDCPPKRSSSTTTSETRPTKLFGVALVPSSGNKRPLVTDEPTSPPAAKPRFVLSNEDLGLNLMPPSSP